MAQTNNHHHHHHNHHEEEKKLMSENAKRYVEENYRWDIICERLCDLI